MSKVLLLKQNICSKFTPRNLFKQFEGKNVSLSQPAASFPAVEVFPLAPGAPDTNNVYKKAKKRQ
jgi:hypothetical protein